MPQRNGQEELRDKPVGELTKEFSDQATTLVRKEIELAKAELAVKGKRAGIGAGMFGGAGFTGVFALLFLSVSAAYGLHWLGVPLGCSFFAIGAIYLILAGFLALTGKKSLTKVGPPEKTIESLKDDAAWAKHPTVAPARRT